MPEKTITPPVDSRAYRAAAGTIAKGVTVVAAGAGEELRAMTASAVNSVSLEPMLNLVCVHKKAKFMEALEREKRFSVNILRREQKNLSNFFAGMWTEETPPDFEFVSWHGLPRLKNCAATIETSLPARGPRPSRSSDRGSIAGRRRSLDRHWPDYGGIPGPGPD